MIHTLFLFQILNILSSTILAIRVPKPPIDLLAPFEGNNFQTHSTNTLLLREDQPKAVSKSHFTTPKPVKTTARHLPNLATRQPRNSHQEQAKPLLSASALNPKREATPQTTNLNEAETTHYERSAGENGLYHYIFKTVNGINVEERGQPKTIPSLSGGDSNDISQDVLGEYSYIAPDGTQIIMNYIANENGFQPTVK